MSDTQAPPCIFCEIVAGRAEASILYQDETVLAFMDLRQVAEGHSLVIPRRHVRDIFGLDAATGAALIEVLQRVATASRDVFTADGLSIWQSNGAPWQEVPHLHFHVMPRHHGDGLLRVYPQLPGHASREVLEAQASRLRSALAGPL